MYENITYEELVKRMMDRALASNKNLDSREGSILWLAEAPAAVELQNLYIALDNILQETFADTASRDYLILRARERGLSPLPATAAVLEMTITPDDLILEMGERFSIGELNYYVSKNNGGGVYEITCETLGEIGNEYGPTVIPIEYVEGLETCQITARLIPGEDEEDTEVFRQRYFDSLNLQAFGGNRADYLQKVNAIPGVGGVKVYRAWNSDIAPATLIPPEEAESWIDSLPQLPPNIAVWLQTVFQAGKNKLLTVGGTVKLVIIDSTFLPPSSTLVDQVQTAIDPTQNAGEGVGIAPIGHVVNVFPVTGKTINLSFALYYQREWSWEDVKPYVEEAVNGYFKELAKSWADSTEPLIIRISQIESRLIDITGILDVAQTKINGEAANYTLPADTIPILGTLSATTATIVGK
ncbi:phage tail protein [Neglecta sp. X4]|uniref:baseplate J/gp47 family protein n=1 Tax=unclassified Neglectibacter TaxID=2632164 RepID=UPI0013B9ADEF|nr:MULTISPECIES: baseplate J/gp47 family protein [unclassified Neglectibacter]NBI18528.1 phage tail protein [Neglectibacter sp. 59]NBJ74240.1 phage tail protein [Neglectibacter sp. X4]NCE82641.1 phage tail protein [Neglectibacter sp. X58]